MRGEPASLYTGWLYRNQLKYNFICIFILLDLFIQLDKYASAYM